MQLLCKASRCVKLFICLCVCVSVCVGEFYAKVDCLQRQTQCVMRGRKQEAEVNSTILEVNKDKLFQHFPEATDSYSSYTYKVVQIELSMYVLIFNLMCSSIINTKVIQQGAWDFILRSQQIDGVITLSKTIAGYLLVVQFLTVQLYTASLRLIQLTVKNFQPAHFRYKCKVEKEK